MGFLLFWGCQVVNFWSRSIELIGSKGLERLAEARVVIIGTGGVGSFVVEGLARAGVGYLELIDPDIVKPSNVNRQLPALSSTLGEPKVEVLARRCRDINPSATIIPRQEAYSPEKSSRFIREDINYIVDAIDDVSAKIDLLVQSIKLKQSIVSSMGTGKRLDPTLLKVADISETRGCPLARVVRRGLKAQGITRGLKVVYTEEPPIKKRQATHDGPKRPIGSMIFVPAVAGLTLASLVVRDLLEGKKHIY
ncbi:MAG: tRNA threonylcarbamoyladenosine dehydratase [Clostridia bacterium]|nr:tRNA threonylcarbamoyladenosine dehydratase [Clostridia bacterium]